MKIKQLKNITDKIRNYQKYEPPQPRNKLLPPTYNIVLSASPKGGGKSYNCIQLLTNYEESGFVSEKGEDVKCVLFGYQEVLLVLNKIVY